VPAQDVPTSANESVPGADVIARRRPYLWLTLVVAAVVWTVDQITKVLAVNALSDRPPIDLIGSILRLNLVRNPGAAFSLGAGFTVIFSLIAIGVVVVVVRTARTLDSAAWAVALGGLLGGALGNLTDRMFRSPGPLRGHVVDFLQLPHWPIFNVADMSVVGSVGLMAYLTLRGVPLTKPTVGAAGE
jgi:signal peptidase II